MRKLAFLALAILTLATSADAQRGGNRGGGSRGSSIYATCGFGSAWDGNYFVHPYHKGNQPYDGRFTFARVWYGGQYKCQSEGPGWAHDFPEAETNFTLILRELTIVKPNMDKYVLLRLDSPELFKYPAIYFSEAGGWKQAPPTEKEIKGLQDYIRKGGFIFFDDLPAGDMQDVAWWMKKIVPEYDILPLQLDHPIFDSFFHITEPWISGSGVYGPDVDFYAMYVNNDPEKRVVAVFNWNNDLGENWQYSHTGMTPVNVTNESYKLGINYYVYALTR